MNCCMILQGDSVRMVSIQEHLRELASRTVPCNPVLCVPVLHTVARLPCPVAFGEAWLHRLCNPLHCRNCTAIASQEELSIIHPWETNLDGLLPVSADSWVGGQDMATLFFIGWLPGLASNCT